MLFLDFSLFFFAFMCLPCAFSWTFPGFPWAFVCFCGLFLDFLGFPWDFVGFCGLLGPGRIPGGHVGVYLALQGRIHRATLYACCVVDFRLSQLFFFAYFWFGF